MVLDVWLSDRVWGVSMRLVRRMFDQRIERWNCKIMIGCWYSVSADVDIRPVGTSDR